MKPSLNLLYALAGVLLDKKWHELPRELRTQLILAVDALADAQRPGVSDRST